MKFNTHQRYGQVARDGAARKEHKKQEEVVRKFKREQAKVKKGMEKKGK